MLTVSSLALSLQEAKTADRITGRIERAEDNQLFEMYLLL